MQFTETVSRQHTSGRVERNRLPTPPVYPTTDSPSEPLSPCIHKTYADLRWRDEFECYFQKRWQRVSVVQKQEVEGVIVLWLRPTKQTSVVEVRRFVGTAAVAVFRDRLTPQSAIERCEQFLLELPPGTPSLPVSEIRRRAAEAGRQLGITALYDACRRLSDRGLLVHKERARCSSVTNLYRPPLLLEPGCFVIEFQGLPSERYGIVAGFKLHLATQSEQPVVRWADGSLSFSSDDRLEPMLTDWKQRWTGISIELAAGRRLRGVNLLPHHIAGLLKAEASAYRELHRLLKMPTVQGVEGYYNRNALLFWLQNFYPRWEE